MVVNTHFLNLPAQCTHPPPEIIGYKLVASSSTSFMGGPTQGTMVSVQYVLKVFTKTLRHTK